MIDTELREYLSDECPEAILFDNPSYDKSIIGHTDDAVVYSYDKMIEELASDTNSDTEEAADFICYDTLKCCDYINSKNKPIIMYHNYI